MNELSNKAKKIRRLAEISYDSNEPFEDVLLRDMAWLFDAPETWITFSGGRKVLKFSRSGERVFNELYRKGWARFTLGTYALPPQYFYGWEIRFNR